MTLQELEVHLSKAKILRALTYPGLRRVARNGRLLEVKQGQMIIGPQMGGTSAYVVLEGTIEVVMPWGPILAHLGPGELFGEIALLQACERTAYCKASEDSKVFEIPFSSFHNDLMTNPVVRGGLEEMALARRAIQEAMRTGRGLPDTSDESDGEAKGPGSAEELASQPAADVGADQLPPAADSPAPDAVPASL
jgi:CRP/FNR family transcriptional regulator, cyclic AMP receptor protein